MKDGFKSVAANENNPKWEMLIKRNHNLYERENDYRSEFIRDYTRVLHCTAYRRLKHKTQVFFSPSSDHVCTRNEHVCYVESISGTIANYLGLNTDLTKAISIAHDIGHSPFGHVGEKILSELSVKYVGETFWHEKNGVNFVDNIELLENANGELQNLELTYAVRDGIISHCGEIDENALRPRSEYIDLLKEYKRPNQYMPYTWEGCVVKIADKISYIGRDIEDAYYLNLLDKKKLQELKEILNIKSEQVLNNTNIINELIIDLCDNSSIEKGLCFSEEKLQIINKIKEFNYKNIYEHPRLKVSHEYFKMIINRIFTTLKDEYSSDTNILMQNLNSKKKYYPKVINEFNEWIYKYTNTTNRAGTNLSNNVVYNIDKEADYCKCIIDFIAGMTDKYIIDIYNEIISF